jgi:hypothetical protein
MGPRSWRRWNYASRRIRIFLRDWRLLCFLLTLRNCILHKRSPLSRRNMRQFRKGMRGLSGFQRHHNQTYTIYLDLLLLLLRVSPLMRFG